MQLTRLEAQHLRGRAALAVAAQRPEVRARFLAMAKKDAKRVAGAKAPWATPLARLLVAGAASQEGDRPAMERELRAAIAELDAADMKLYAAAARWRLGEVQAAEDWMRGEGIAFPGKDGFHARAGLRDRS